jgi:hypothetical protein
MSILEQIENPSRSKDTWIINLNFKRPDSKVYKGIVFNTIYFSVLEDGRCVVQFLIMAQTPGGWPDDRIDIAKRAMYFDNVDQGKDFVSDTLGEINYNQEVQWQKKIGLSTYEDALPPTID